MATETEANAATAADPTTDPARLLMIGLSGPELTPDERAFLAERPPGGICLFGRNIADRYQSAEFVAEIREVTGQRLLVATDQEGGGVVRLRDLPYPPSAMALGAADDPDLTRRVAVATGRGLRAVGIDVDFAPVADVNANPRNPVIADRSFGSHPSHVGRHVRAFVEGLQAAGVAAVVKHFPGHGDVDVDSHLDLPTLRVDLERLRDMEFPPFRAALQAGVAGVMSAHIVVPALDEALPATLSPAVIRGILRDRWGFDGVVFTDALEMGAVAARWSAGEAAVLALAAGVDMPVQTTGLAAYREMIAGAEQAVDDGRLARRDLQVSAARIDRLAREFPPGSNVSDAWEEADAHEETVAEAARRGLVALGELPRIRPGQRVAILAAEEVRASAASQLRARPVDAFIAALHERGVEVAPLRYRTEDLDAVSPVDRSPADGSRIDGSQPDGSPQDVGDLAAPCDAMLFVSTSRTRMKAAEIALANRVANAGRPFCHVALWNPYHVADIRGPALVTFSFAPEACSAAADALLGAATPGRAPVALATSDGMTAQS